MLTLSILLTLSFIASAYAAGSSCVVTSTKLALMDYAPTATYDVTVTCVADDTDGSFPELDITNVGGTLVNVKYYPDGTTAPSAGMNLSIQLGETGIELLGEDGTDLVATADAILSPKNTSGDIYPASFEGDIKLVATGNSVNDAGFTAILAFWK